MAPALVPTTSGATLAHHLKLSELPLATTPGGKVFCLKALHPSEHTIKAARVPGGNDLSVAICSDQIFNIPTTANNFNVNITQFPNIVVPATIHAWAPGTPGTRYNMYNAAFGGTVITNPTSADTAGVLANITGKISSYRVTSQSVTVELIAPTLTDQGAITSYQGHNPCITVSPTVVLVNGTGDYTGTEVFSDIHVMPEIPGAAAGLLGSNAYTAKAREGCYQPLKLSTFKWKNFNDRVVYETDARLDPNAGAAYIHNFATTADLVLPYYETRGALTTWQAIPAIPRLCGDTYGRISIGGLATGVSVRIRLRQVVEIVVPPGTTYAPMVELPLPPDETALKMYFEVSARMKDGYPASYNDLGTLFKVITSVGNKVLPYVDPALDFLRKMPGDVGEAADILKNVKDLAKSGVTALKPVKDSEKAIQTLDRAKNLVKKVRGKKKNKKGKQKQKQMQALL